MKRLTSFWLTVRNHSIITLSLIAGLILYGYRLAAIPTGALAPAEQQARLASSSLHTLASQPFFLPMNVLRWLTIHLLPAHQALALRLPSVAIGFMALAAMLYIVRRWYGARTLLFAIALLLTSAWFLHASRVATNDVLYLAAPAICIALSLLVYEHPDRKLALLAWVVAMMLALYIPGLIWFVLLSLTWQRQELKESFTSYGWLQKLLLFIVAAVLCAPFLYGATHHVSLDFGLSWLGLPTVMPSWHAPLKNVAAAFLFVFVRTPKDPTLWLGRLPLLDAFMAVSFIAGIAFYLGHLKAARTRLLIAYGLLGLLLCAAGGSVTRSVLVSLVYLTAFGGIAYLLHQWLQLFPRNPLARRLGIGLVVAAVALSSVYGIRQYFVAWPHNADTKQTFTVPR